MVSLSNHALVSPYARSSPEVRSGNSSLEFCWRGVSDPTVSRFDLRFLHGSRPLSGWSPLDAYKTCCVLEKPDLTFPVGNVSAQIRAVNERSMTSELVSAAVRVDDSKPALTGIIMFFSFISFHP